MSAQGAHIIHRVVLQIEVPQRSMAKPVQDEVMRCWENEILPRIQELLDTLDNSDHHTLIDQLVLKVGMLDKKLLSAQLADATLHRLDEAIAKAANTDTEDETNSTVNLDSGQIALEALMYFLQKGGLPWYVGPQTEWLRDEQQWLQKILPVIAASTNKSRQLLNMLASSPQALLRLFAQFSVSFIRQIAKVILNIDDAFIERQSLLLKEIIHAGLSESKKTDLAALFDIVAIENMMLFILLLYTKSNLINDAELEQIGQHFIPSLQKRYDGSTTINKQNLLTLLADVIKEQAPNTLPTETVESLPEAEDKKDLRDDVDGLFVKQAGVIILHPFLEYFFRDFALVDESDLVDEAARQLAVHLLHYMATGETQAFEHDLQMEKFLCAWPEEKPVERLVNLPEGMLTEADNLLRAAIKHWKALKNTSPDGLREGFLTRSGKLITSEETPRLIIERSDLDILLSSLPWGIGVVKLPWMPKPLYVEWP